MTINVGCRVFAEALVVALLLGGGAWAGITDDWPSLGDTLYPRQHADPRNSDHTPVDGLISLDHVYTAVPDYAMSQPCAVGSTGLMYCVASQDSVEGRCNLSVVDVGTGRLVWKDRVDGACLLDDATGISVALIDFDGNLYAGGPNVIASFSADGALRWVNDIPSRLPSRKGLPNNPFGFPRPFTSWGIPASSSSTPYLPTSSATCPSRDYS